VYREIFFNHYGYEGPWTCVYCEKEIIVGYGRLDISLVVHHVDEDRSNNELENLNPMHRDCHGKHHQTGQTHSEESRAKMSQSQIGRKHSPETKGLMRKGRLGEANPFYGKKHTPESLEKMSGATSGPLNPFFGKAHTEETKKKIGKANSGRPSARLGTHMTEESRKLLKGKLRVKAPCPDCGILYNPSWMTRHKNVGRCIP